ncbi:MAG: hypothetical protein HQL25_07905 [Candidatus Omnitrophica bacterium]|nr:hypothetical protein [Candidatus Omnitrophota bacterium]
MIYLKCYYKFFDIKMEGDLHGLHKFYTVLPLFPAFQLIIFSFIGLQGLITQKPFIINAKWIFSAVIAFCISWDLCLSKANNNVVCGLFIIFCLLLIFIKIKTCLALGITNTSLQEALSNTLKKLDIKFEETPGFFKLTSETGDITIINGKIGGQVSLTPKNIQNKNLFKNIMNELNLYLKTNSVERNTYVFISLLILGITWFIFMTIGQVR